MFTWKYKVPEPSPYHWAYKEKIHDKRDVKMYIKKFEKFHAKVNIQDTSNTSYIL